MEPFIRINGNPYPHPARGLEFIVSTIVDSARNGNAEVVGQKVGRDQQKLNALVWPYLKADVWSAILKEFENFYAEVTYPDMVNNTWTTRKMYPGDRSAQPYRLDPATGLPSEYIQCTVNIIDTGAPL